MSPSPAIISSGICNTAPVSGDSDGAGEVEGNAQTSGLSSWEEGGGNPPPTTHMGVSGPLGEKNEFS